MRFVGVPSACICSRSPLALGGSPWTPSEQRLLWGFMAWGSGCSRASSRVSCCEERAVMSMYYWALFDKFLSSV